MMKDFLIAFLNSHFLHCTDNINFMSVNIEAMLSNQYKIVNIKKTESKTVYTFKSINDQNANLVDIIFDLSPTHYITKIDVEEINKAA